MDILRSQAGAVHIEFTSADMASLLTQISQRNISLENLAFIDEMTVRACVSRRDFLPLKSLIKSRGDGIKMKRRSGIYWHLRGLRSRPVLLGTIAGILFLSLFLPSRILFVRVEGNHTIPTRLVLEKAEECGISIFASGRNVRSEKVKNALIEKIPQLQWAGVNTKGCVATICVSEKTVGEEENTPGGICSIVASRDGVISELTVLQGNPVCRVGQAVKEGQVLISGYTDCGICIKGTRADGEVYGQTIREIEVVTPVITQKRATEQLKTKKYSLIFGKKLIKLYKGSGISDTSCVRIYEETRWTLPGGFSLPIALVCETVIDNDFTDCEPSEEYDWLETETVDYLRSQMIAGKILDQRIELQAMDDVYCLRGRFSCLEMIGQIKNEEILQR